MRSKSLEVDTSQQTFQIVRKLVYSDCDAESQDSFPGWIGGEIDEFPEAIIVLCGCLCASDVILQPQRHAVGILVKNTGTGPGFWISNEVFDRTGSKLEDQDVTIIIVASLTYVDVKRPLSNRNVM